MQYRVCLSSDADQTQHKGLQKDRVRSTSNDTASDSPYMAGPQYLGSESDTEIRHKSRLRGFVRMYLHHGPQNCVVDSVTGSRASIDT